MATTCLIAEADPFIARLLGRFAEESGLRYVRARVGQEVLPLARRSKPAALIIEVELPGEIRGWEAVRAVRADQETRHIAVISCSWLSEADAQKLIGETAGHLQKPDLHYADFVRALEGAGVSVGFRSEYQEASSGDGLDRKED
jgi:CheY-like chemotaxis protein